MWKVCVLIILQLFYIKIHVAGAAFGECLAMSLICTSEQLYRYKNIKWLSIV